MMTPAILTFLKNISVHDIPHKFIHSARVVGDNGEIITVKDKELERLLNGDHSFSETSFMVDVDFAKIIESISIETEYMYMLAKKMDNK